MKKFPPLIFLAFLSVGCGIKDALPTDTAIRPSLDQSATSAITLGASTPTPKSTASPVKSLTVIIPTSTPTVNPTITKQPTYTVTLAPSATLTIFPPGSYDASLAVTHTPSAPAVCPDENPGLRFQFGDEFDAEKPEIETPIRDFLDQGGTRQAVIEAFAQHFETRADFFYEQDVTDDGVLELVIPKPYLHIFGCDEGQYRTYLKVDPGGIISGSGIIANADMNLDGLDELVVVKADATINLYQNPTYQIFGWDGFQFKNLVIQPDFVSRYGGGGVTGGDIWVDGNSNWEIRDIDNNGTQEFVMRGGIPVHPDTYMHGPWRAETDTYMWNGAGFVLYGVEPDAPKYHFQAIQDADYAFFDGNFDEAIDLYQQVIFSDQLDWWSDERAWHEMQVWQAEYAHDPTPTPLPVDNMEYYNLAGYARYRIMLLHVVRGWMPDAKTVYETLQEKFPEGQEGHIFAELASAFWLEYQSSQDIGSACAKAIEYTAQNQCTVFDFVSVITGCTQEGHIIYHGWQKERDYVLEDICPFK